VSMPRASWTRSWPCVPRRRSRRPGSAARSPIVRTPILSSTSSILGPTPQRRRTGKGARKAASLPGGTTTSFQGNLETKFYNLRIGPTFELDLSKRLSFATSFGYAPVYADAQFKYANAVTFSNPALPGLAPTQAEVSEGNWRLGFYAEIRLNYRFTSHIDAFVGGDFQNNSNFTFGDSAYHVKLQLGATYGTKIGMTFRF